ncbi:MAG: hypothetical protein U0Q16_30250 [Bryobacteraceae bacterium]
MTMHWMMRAQLPTGPGNEAVVSGNLAKTIQAFIAAHKPDSAYFLTEDGMRTARFVVAVTDPSQMPAFAEPFFLLGASVQFYPVMTGEDLARGLAAAK